MILNSLIRYQMNDKYLTGDTPMPLAGPITK